MGEECKFNDELDDRETFEYDWLRMLNVKVCACCGQEQNLFDVQRFVDEPASIGHMIMTAAYDTTATTKVDRDVLTRRLKASIALLGRNSNSN